MFHFVFGVPRSICEATGTHGCTLTTFPVLILVSNLLFFSEPVKIHPGDRIGDAAEGEESRNNSSELFTENHSQNDVEQHNENYHRRVQLPHHQQTMHLNSTEQQNANTHQLPRLLGNMLADNNEIKEEATPIEHTEFQKIRQILCAVLGVLTRLSFLCSFGNEYVQVRISVVAFNYK